MDRNNYRTPPHVAIIMDGNGRWASARGLPRTEGHRAGRAAVNRTVAAALDLRVGVLTLFTFSTENWGRPAAEVAELMRTFEDFFHVDAPALTARGVRVTVIGRRDRLPVPLRDAIERVELPGGENLPAAAGSFSPSPTPVRPYDAPARLHVRFAIDYSGREAIFAAARRFQNSGESSAEDFSRLFAAPEDGAEPVPDIDLLIRTGGEQRLSNCPLWEIAYAELYFTPCLWPDFGAAELEAALQDFYHRERRFGRIPAEVA